MENEAIVDGEMEFLMGMFNFDQCSSDSSSYDDYSSFGTTLQEKYPAVLDISDHKINLNAVSQGQEKPWKRQKLSEGSNLVIEPKKDSQESESPSSFNCSDDETRTLSLATNNTSKRLKGKAKRNKGIACDPQSLYARKRRKRINDRLKTLQNLVPNGTKVDISTMLEEAVHYVKFLQLQIKLLSSDDLWMYAPPAHNGLNMELQHNLLSRLM